MTPLDKTAIIEDIIPRLSKNRISSIEARLFMVGSVGTNGDLTDRLSDEIEVVMVSQTSSFTREFYEHLKGDLYIAFDLIIQALNYRLSALTMGDIRPAINLPVDKSDELPDIDAKNAKTIYAIPNVVKRSPESVYGPYKASPKEQVELPFPLRLAWDPTVEVRKMYVNSMMASPLIESLTELAERFSAEEIRNSGIDLFGGCYNVRKIRGGNTMSSHSWAIAVDWNPRDNGMYDSSPKFFWCDVHTEFAKILYRHGFRTFSHDLMHWQFVPKTFR